MDAPVLGFAEARDELRSHVDHLIADPSHPPVVFGARRKPEAVLMSYEALQGLMSRLALLEDLGITAVAKDRTLEEAEVVTFDQLAREAGFDPDDFKE